MERAVSMEAQGGLGELVGRRGQAVEGVGRPVRALELVRLLGQVLVEEQVSIWALEAVLGVLLKVGVAAGVE